MVLYKHIHLQYSRLDHDPVWFCPISSWFCLFVAPVGQLYTWADGTGIKLLSCVYGCLCVLWRCSVNWTTEKHLITTRADLYSSDGLIRIIWTDRSGLHPTPAPSRIRCVNLRNLCHLRFLQIANNLSISRKCAKRKDSPMFQKLQSQCFNLVFSVMFENQNKP